MDFLENIDSAFTGKNSLRDTRLEKILINNNHERELQIELIFTNFRKKSDFEMVKILFQGVKEFSFYHNSDYDFYSVENYKFLKIKDLIYISLDPDESTEMPSPNDLDFIFSEKVEVAVNLKGDP